MNRSLLSFKPADGPEVYLTIEDGIITDIGSNIPRANDAEVETINITGARLFPGFIDVHTHGAVGVDVNEADPDGLLKIAGFLAQHGVTAWMPTLVPDTDDNYRRAIDAIDQLMLDQVGQPVAQALGVHYEGVFASERMCGALRPKYFKTFTGGEIDELPRLKSGVHMTTVAPEIENGIELIQELVDDWIVSVGHTRANAATLDAALMAGARHMTHFFNAMTGIHHREIGVAGWGLANDEVTFDIIADGVHVDPDILKFACRAKTADKVSLISDSVAPTGLGDGQYSLWGETISVVDGRTRNERGSIAGSVSTMLDGVRMMTALAFSDVDVASMASLNPAALLGLDGQLGSIETGKRADLVGLDVGGAVVFVMVGGQMCQLM